MILVVCLSYTFHSLIVLSNSIELKLCGERGVGGGMRRMMSPRIERSNEQRNQTIVHTIGREEEMRIMCVGGAPLNLIDLLLDFQTLEIIKFLLMALKLCHDLVFCLLLQ